MKILAHVQWGEEGVGGGKRDLILDSSMAFASPFPCTYRTPGSHTNYASKHSTDIGRHNYPLWQMSVKLVKIVPIKSASHVWRQFQKGSVWVATSEHCTPKADYTQIRGWQIWNTKLGELSSACFLMPGNGNVMEMDWNLILWKATDGTHREKWKSKRRMRHKTHIQRALLFPPCDIGDGIWSPSDEAVKGCCLSLLNSDAQRTASNGGWDCTREKSRALDSHMPWNCIRHTKECTWQSVRSGK